MGLTQYWEHTDLVTQTLFVVLLLLSVASWIVGILRLYHSQKLMQALPGFYQPKLHQATTSLHALPDQVRKVRAEPILLQFIADLRHLSERGLTLLGTTASIAPFLGLLGTVWSIFHALHNVGQSGQAGLAQVAGPVGEALIMTALGLAVAIPAVVFYNVALRQNRKLLYHANDLAYEVLKFDHIEPSVDAKSDTKAGQAIQPPLAQPVRGEHGL